MIPKANVKTIELKHGQGNKFFKVSGMPGNWKQRMYHQYAQALRYSRELSDYYQAEVKETY